MKTCLTWINIRYFLCLTFLFGLCSFLLIVVNTKTSYLPPHTKYGMVFDAGSVHTALYVYQWPADKDNDTGIVSQNFVCMQKGGISFYADNPAKAGESLRNCLDKAMPVIPTKQQKETPILLGATAGMRLLRMKNQTQADQILAEVSKTIKTYPLDFQGARILTGEEEGSLGWITINYLLRTFIEYTFEGGWAHPRSTEIVGAMDMGGASTEMTFQPSGPIKSKDSSIFFRLYGFNYRVYTHSYLCYGLFDALERYLGKIIAAFSAFYKIFRFLNLTDGQSLDVVNSTIWEFCSTKWTVLTSKFPTADQKWLHGYCEASIYILTLLLDGFKFNDQTWKNINFREQAGNADIGWSLGYMLNLTNKIPSEAPAEVTGHSYVIWVATVTMSFLTALLILCVVLVHCIQTPVSSYETLM
ncbi:ectonucleoside triphosphate diphosphohydrolase 8-like isoform X2 [Pleurodeles waltl]|uniref:ectonucleoside triphosphate diphosphohydrolase 8-like isoform X2 n=1 Tax=Pleurodeles waltl TaxID=8319 RepID=UPI003709C35E